MSSKNDFLNNDGDAIGGTVYSKQWLIQCLLKLIKFIENEPNLYEYVDESSNLDTDSVEEELCILWDMSSNEDVQNYLMEFQADKIFSNTVLKTKNPRLAEIAIGILANLCHNIEISTLISNNRIFCFNAISLLSASDIPFLIQLIRFLNTVLHKNEDNLLSIIEENAKVFFKHIEYLFANCLNIDLLKSLFQYTNDILYKRSDLGKFWWNNEFKWLSVLCQACHQILTSLDEDIDNIEKESQFFFNFWFIVEMLIRENSYIRDLDFSEHLFQLKELFCRFEQFLDCSINSISSYSAACVVFMKLNSIENVNEEQMETLKRFQENMAQDEVIKSIFEKFISRRQVYENLCTDKEMLQNIATNIEEFYCSLFPS